MVAQWFPEETLWFRNYDNATATDILQLMDDVKATVKDNLM